MVEISELDLIEIRMEIYRLKRRVGWLETMLLIYASLNVIKFILTYMVAK